MNISSLKSSLLAAGTALALVVGLSACATEPAATADGTVVVYAGRDEALIAPLIEQFTQETGIDVDVRYGSTPELSALLLEEGERTPANVFLSQDAGALGALSDAGLLATLPADITDAVQIRASPCNTFWLMSD